LKLVVRAPARLHLGFIDLHGGCGRLFGSLGVALESPAYVLEASICDRTEANHPAIQAHGPSADAVLGIVARLGLTRDSPRGEGMAPGKGLRIHVREAIPRHRGFGSGTQLELAIAFTVSKLQGDGLPLRELAKRTSRGKRSGIGVATFERGGFVVDAGTASDELETAPNEFDPRRGEAGPTTNDAEPDSGDARTPRTDSKPAASATGRGVSDRRRELPPVIFQHPLPEDWHFVIVTPGGKPGLNGAREDRAFAGLPPMNEDKVGRISRLTLMKILPAVITDDIEAFGEGISEIQELVGNHFAPYQGGVYATETGRRATELARKRGACGVGQSSWGPTVFALVRGEDQARDVAEEIRACLGADTEAVFQTRASNRGVAWRTEP
jgi:beta-ribofuranosylaminobenzene 5'-phosphate synthase